MYINEKLKELIDSIKLTSFEAFEKSIKGITKKLNRKYYESDSEEAHLYIVGSTGRGTAIKGVSDIDIIFDLPKEVYSKYNACTYNGQSALLQEIKNVLKEKYTQTEIKGDGQVVSIGFDKYTVELVPAFRQEDSSFKYPDSNDDGSWKKTDPLPEQSASKQKANDTEGKFVGMCNLMRCWKDNIGFKFGGLLIDTLVFNFFEDEITNKYLDNLNMLISLFEFLAEQNKDQAYWYALGSKQQVKNSGKGAFVKKASKALKRIEKANTDEGLIDALMNIFGRKFSKLLKDTSSCVAPKEEFIEDRYLVNITEDVEIACNVSQPGFRTFDLSDWFSGKIKWLLPGKKLNFFIKNISVKEPYCIFWKVRNIGAEARRRSMERGSIFAGGKAREERTDFNGKHYVECYIVKDNICVARDRINVPIDINSRDDQ